MDREVLASLQAALLKSVLSGQALPGGGPPIRLPDTGFFARQQEFYIDDENVAGPLAIEDLPKPVHVEPVKSLQERARTQGEIALLHFQPPEVTDGDVRLTLEGRLFSATGRAALGLSGVQVTFSRVGDEWRAGTPSYFAA